jgi:hypothetical protein
LQHASGDLASLTTYFCWSYFCLYQNPWYLGSEASAIQTKLICLRNRVCLFVFLLNVLLVTVIYALTQVNAFTNSLSIRITCSETTIDVVPISILFGLVFGLLGKFSDLFLLKLFLSLSESMVSWIGGLDIIDVFKFVAHANINFAFFYEIDMFT